YVYLYSEFGGQGVVTENGTKFQWDSCDGFEEWALREGPTQTVTDLMPEPSMGVLLLLTMLPVGGLWRRRKGS
ncbi:PEP-CTERM sorting domain-containing protein, partial [bacterium]|nr:PEP-CTERM sorting domain-containing protein [bacterium]